jgi:hypothetical protein
VWEARTFSSFLRPGVEFSFAPTPQTCCLPNLIGCRGWAASSAHTKGRNTHNIKVGALSCVFKSERAAEASNTLMFLAGLYHLISSHTLYVMCARAFSLTRPTLHGVVDVCIALKGRHNRQKCFDIAPAQHHTNAPRFGGDKEIAFVSPLKRQTARSTSAISKWHGSEISLLLRGISCNNSATQKIQKVCRNEKLAIYSSALIGNTS